MKYIKTWVLLLLTVFGLMQSAHASQQATTPAIKILGIIGTTKITLVQGDITKQNNVDAIVNAANDGLQHWDGVAAAISRAADLSMTSDQKKQSPPNSSLQQHCDGMPNFSGYNTKCPEGKAVITPSFDLKAEGIKKIIHTAGPRGVNPNKQKLLHDAYQNSLKVAQENSLKIVAFPAISTAIFGYHINEATPVAFAAVRDFIKENGNDLDEVRFVVFSDADLAVYKQNHDLFLDDADKEPQPKDIAAGDDVLKDEKDKPTNAGYSTKQYLIGAFGVGITGFVSWLIYTRFFSHN